MPQVLVLIADPASRALDPALAGAVREKVGGLEPDWLAPGIACDIALPARTVNRKTLENQAREAIGNAPVDVAVMPAEGRHKKFLVADMDSTIIGQECIDELADLVGLKTRVAAITERAMRGEIDFEPALRERVALLKGIAVETLKRLLDQRINLNPGAVELVSTMRANGAYTALVSGGFTAFTGPVAARVGFDENRANVLETDGGKLTGTVREPILGKEAKRQALLDISARLGLEMEATLAVGDGANDLAMLELSGLGVAYRAKPAVAAAADVRIDHADLTALLYLQGYRETEIRT